MERSSRNYQPSSSKRKLQAAFASPNRYFKENSRWVPPNKFKLNKEKTKLLVVRFKQQKTFSVFVQPDINTRGVGRVRDSYANPRRSILFTYSHANTPLGQSERAYYLSYFITRYRPRHALNHIQIGDDVISPCEHECQESRSWI